MPKLRKITVEEAVKPKGKRGRPKGSENKQEMYVFTAEDGCELEAGIRNVTATCKHGYNMVYKKTVLR